MRVNEGLAMLAGGRFSAALAAGIGAFLLGGIGLSLGLAATSVPDVEPSEWRDGVEVWVNDAQTRVDLTWYLLRNGDVQIIVSIPETEDSAVRVLIALSCDARMDDIAYYNSYEDDRRDPGRALKVHEASDEFGCEDATGNDLAPSHQLIEISLSGGDYEYIDSVIGTPHRAWTSAGSGIRVARTPSLGLGDPDTELEVAQGYHRPPAESQISAAFFSSLTEMLDITVVPNGAEMQQDAATFDDDDVLSVSWGFTYPESVPETEGQTGIGSGLVRWTDPPAQSRSSMLLLFSGVLLGVAASLVVEYMVISRFQRAPLVTATPAVDSASETVAMHDTAPVVDPPPDSPPPVTKVDRERNV